MSFAATTLTKPMSMATNGCLISTPSLPKVSSSYPHLSIPLKPLKLQLSCSYSFPLKRRKSLFSVSSIATQQEENNQAVILEEKEEEFGGNSNLDSPENEIEGEENDGYVEPPEEAKVYVGNLPYDVDSEKLAQLFEPAGVVEIVEVIYNRETDQSRGFGFVTMSTVEEADKAVEMFHRYDLNGRLLTVNKASPRGSSPDRPPRGFEPFHKIYVGNLSWGVDDKRLEEIFSQHGKVVNARVVSDRDTGRSRGFGFVVMSSEDEMKDAIESLDGQSFEGRAIKVNAAENRPNRNNF